MLRPEAAEKIRAQIQTTQIAKRLADHVLGGKDPKTKKPVELSTTQVTAALGLLKKTLPDLSAVDFKGDLAIKHEDALDSLE